MRIAQPNLPAVAETQSVECHGAEMIEHCRRAQAEGRAIYSAEHRRPGHWRLLISRTPTANIDPVTHTNTMMQTTETEPRPLTPSDTSAILLHLAVMKRFQPANGEPCNVRLGDLTACYCRSADAKMTAQELLAHVERLRAWNLVDSVNEDDRLFTFHQPTGKQLLFFCAALRLAAEERLAADLIFSRGYAPGPDKGNTEAADLFLRCFRACLAELEATVRSCEWISFLKVAGHHAPTTAAALTAAAERFSNPPVH